MLAQFSILCYKKNHKYSFFKRIAVDRQELVQNLVIT